MLRGCHSSIRVTNRTGGGGGERRVFVVRAPFCFFFFFLKHLNLEFFLSRPVGFVVYNCSYCHRVSGVCFLSTILPPHPPPTPCPEEISNVSSFGGINITKDNNCSCYACCGSANIFLFHVAFYSDNIRSCPTVGDLESILDVNT